MLHKFRLLYDIIQRYYKNISYARYGETRWDTIDAQIPEEIKILYMTKSGGIGHGKTPPDLILKYIHKFMEMV